MKLDDISGWDDGLICGGQATILIQPQLVDHLEPVKQLVAAEKSNGIGALVTKISRVKSIVTQCEWWDGNALSSAQFSQYHEEMEVAVQKGKAMLLGDSSKSGSELQFIEPCLPKPELLIAGAGHVGKAVGKLASMMGFKAIVVDDRPEFACQKNLPEIDHVICGNIPETIKKWQIRKNTFIVIVTRGHQHDGASLGACVKSQAGFIGMIGAEGKVC